MNNNNKSRLCPVSHAGTLDNRIRRMLQDPVKILTPFIKDKMTVLDIGCGPGFFSIAMANMVGESGRIIAVDMQEGMLQKVKKKIKGTEIENRIILHKCEEDRLNIKEYADFALAFYMVHEVSDQEAFFREIISILKPSGKFLVVEPKIFHVSKKEFENTVNIAENAGFKALPGPKVFFGRTVIFKRPNFQVM